MADTIWILIESLAYIFLYSLMAKQIFPELICIVNPKKYLFIFIMYIFNSILIINGCFNFMNFLPLISIILFTMGSISKKILISFITLIVMLIIQQMVIIIIDPDALYIETHFMDKLSISSFFAFIICIIILMFMRKHQQKTLDISSLSTFICAFIILSLCSALFPLLLVRYLQDIIPFRTQIIIIILSYATIIITTVTVYMYMRNYNERILYLHKSNESKELLEEQKKYFEQTVKDYEYLNSFKHDIRGHLRVMQELNKKGGNKNFEAYLSNIQNIIDNIYQCDNVYISAVINSFMEDCKTAEIFLKVDYSINGEITIDATELCALMNNLLNNALEAEQKISQQKKIITISIFNIDNHLIIEVENDIPESFNMDNLIHCISSKEDGKNHGYGLKKIKEVVEKYDGNIEYTKMNSRLHIEIILQDTVKQELI